jgi:hypothetical protein
VSVAQFPDARQTADGTKVQSVGHTSSVAKEHDGDVPLHWQHLGGVGVGVGVNVAQLPEAKHTASGTNAHVSGHVPLAGAKEHDGDVPSHWQQSTGVGVGVGVNVAQLPDGKHAANATGVHASGHVPVSATDEHSGPAHWQQLGNVGDGVGVAVAALPVGVGEVTSPHSSGNSWQTGLP